jgi:DNA replication protein DnaC
MLESIRTKTPEEIEKQNTERQTAAAESAKRRNDRLRKQLKADSGIVGDMWERTFDAFMPSMTYPESLRALKICQAFVKHLPNTKPSLMLYGDTGRGKSHLAIAAAIAAMEQEDPLKVLYVDCVQLEAIVKKHKRSDVPLEEKMLAADLLVLDDIEKGLAGDASAWVRALIKGVLENVDSTGKPILLATSNFSLEQHQAFLGKPGEWIASRLAKIFLWQHVDGENYRLREYAEREKPAWWAE